MKKTKANDSQFFIDITMDVCPLTFVKTKLALERLNNGEILEVRLKGVEPLANVPRSAQEHGHEVLAMTPEPGEEEGGVHRLRIKVG